MRRYKRKHKREGEFKSGLEQSISKRLPKGSKYEASNIAYVLPKKYKPDFDVPTEAGKIVYLEVKGWMRYEDQQKMRAVKFSNPDLDIRFYFPKDQKVQNSKMTNSQWCQKYGFPYAIGRLPRGWFK